MLANLVYLAALLLLAPVILDRMIRHRRYRRGLREKLFGLSFERAAEIGGGGPCVWIHAVSVGEVNLLSGVVERLEQADPLTRIAISTSTDTGFDLAVQRFGAERVFFCPLDFTWAVARTIRHLAPQQLILAELELWPNLIRTAKAHGCRVVVINARLSQRSADRYQQASFLTRSIFQNLDWVGCQSDACRDRFFACGTPADKLAVTGSLKFDGAPTSREAGGVNRCAQWAGIDPWHRVWVVGSTQEGEERMALEIYEQLREQHSELRMILVPRHRERFEEVAKLITDVGLRVHRRSRDRSLFDSQWEADQIILVDTIGELRHWWGVGQIATVGGSFGNRGGQNMLEPAGYGCAVSFGPNTRNFDEIARQLIQHDAAVRVRDQPQLASFVRRCLQDIPAADSLGRAARKVIRTHRGALKQTIEAIAAPGKSTRRAA